MSFLRKGLPLSMMPFGLVPRLICRRYTPRQPIFHVGPPDFGKGTTNVFPPPTPAFPHKLLRARNVLLDRGCWGNFPLPDNHQEPLKNSWLLRKELTRGDTRGSRHLYISKPRRPSHARVNKLSPVERATQTGPKKVSTTKDSNHPNTN